MTTPKWREEQPAKKIPRCEHGSDWGRERRLLLDAGPHGRVFVWPGHTAWSGLGTQSYYETKVEVEYHDGNIGARSHTNLISGGRVTIARLNDPEVRRLIALRLRILVEHLPQLHPRKTMSLVR